MNTNDKGSEKFSDYVICAFKMPVSSASTEVKTCKQSVKIHTVHGDTVGAAVQIITFFLSHKNKMAERQQRHF